MGLLSRMKEEHLIGQYPFIQKVSVLMYTTWVIYAQCTHDRSRALGLWNKIVEERTVRYLVGRIMVRHFRGVQNWITKFQGV